MLECLISIANCKYSRVLILSFALSVGKCIKLNDVNKKYILNYTIKEILCLFDSGCHFFFSFFFFFF